MSQFLRLVSAVALLAAGVASAPPARAADVFPITIEHKYGSTTIASEPRRVVTLGYSEQDPVLALGVVPVAVRDWFGDQPSAVWPWAREKLGQATPAVLKMPFGELDFETIAGSKPDLIVAVHSGITEKEYARLTQIAPTLAQSGNYVDFGMPWQDQTRTIGRALGRAEAADKLVADVEAQIAAVAARHPEFNGRRAAMAATASGQGQYWAYSPRVPPVRVLSALGFVLPPEIGSLVGDKDAVQISREQLSLLDVDVVIWYVASPEERSAIDNDPLYQQLRVAREGRGIFFVSISDLLRGAFSFSTVLSLPYALERLEPQLVAALDGDQKTTPEAAPYPVTIDHKFGRTIIPQAPKRIVSVGYNDQDPILALGSQPLAVRYWFGNQPGAVWPWARERLGGATPQVMGFQTPTGELNFEAIAALAPDLIVGVYAGLKQEEYDRLAQIAPTVAQSDRYVDYGVPWQETTQVIGRALGRDVLARRLVAENEQRFADARTAHPEFNSKTAAIGMPASDGQFFFSGPQHERQRFLSSLGFTLPDQLTVLAGDAFYGTLSGEQLQLLDTDVLIWMVEPGQRESIESHPLYRQLRAAREGRDIFLDISGDADMAGSALVFSSVLSLPTAFDLLVPRLVAAVDGDPATEVTP